MTGRDWDRLGVALWVAMLAALVAWVALVQSAIGRGWS